MKHLLLALLLAGCGASHALPVTATQSIPLSTDVSTRAHLTIVNGFTTAVQFSQQPTCGKPFPFSDAQGRNEWTVQALSTVVLTQTGPACFDTQKGQRTRILAGYILEKYDCGIEIDTSAKGGYLSWFYLQGRVSNCTILRTSPTDVTFIWNVKGGE